MVLQVCYDQAEHVFPWQLSDVTDWNWAHDLSWCQGKIRALEWSDTVKMCEILWENNPSVLRYTFLSYVIVYLTLHNMSSVSTKPFKYAF